MFTVAYEVLKLADNFCIQHKQLRFLTLCVTEITVRVRQSPPDLMRSTTCLWVEPSTFTPFLQQTE